VPAPSGGTTTTPAPAAAPPAPAPQHSSSVAPPASTPAQPGSCRRSWLARGTSRSFFLLGLDAAALQRCLGPASHHAKSARTELWRYAGLDVSLSGGRVDGFTLTGGSWRSTPDAVGIGSARDKLEQALGRLSTGRTRGALYGRIALGGGRAATVQVLMSRGVARRIAVTTRTGRQK
jgi:hypothetical protein